MNSELEKNYLPNWMKVLTRLIAASIIFSAIILIFTPWQQTSQGTGRVLALDPNDRLQNINSFVSGRVDKWYVQDGSKVKEGDLIVEIVDNDPEFLERLTAERDAVLMKYNAVKEASDIALLDYRRQEALFKEGLSARTKFEKASIEYKKLLSQEASAAASLAKAEVKLSRQKTQSVFAPRDGTILRVLHGTGSVSVKEGDVLATFVPETVKQAAEIYIDGNDLPLVYPGRKVRLQFEGWPAVQFSGWPSVAIGTFGGKVTVIDPSVSINGKFRILVVADEDEEPWPKEQFLKQGSRVYGWVLLNTVKLGYEFWRQLNGFPASMNEQPDKIDNSKSKKDTEYKSDKKEKNDNDEYESK